MTSGYFYNTGPVYLCLFVLPCWTTRWRYLILRELIEGVIRLRRVTEAAVFDPVFANICGWAQLCAEYLLHLKREIKKKKRWTVMQQRLVRFEVYDKSD